MVKAIVLTVVIVLAVIGLTEILHSFCEWVLSGRRKQYVLSIVPCKKEEENLEYAIKSIYLQLKSQNHCKDCRIVLVDCGMDDETRKSAELLSKGNNCILLYSKEVLSEWLFEKFHLQIEP